MPTKLADNMIIIYEKILELLAELYRQKIFRKVQIHIRIIELKQQAI